MSVLILKILETKDNYDRYSSFIDGLSNETKTIFNSIKDYYKDTKRSDINWDSFSTWFFHAKYPGMKFEHRVVYGKLFETLRDEAMPEEDITSIVNSFISRGYAEEIAQAALRIAAGEGGNMDAVADILQRHDTELKRNQDIKEFKWGDRIEKFSGGYNWRLECLNKALGPLSYGLIVIGARPDTGKTTFLASEATHMASQMDPERYVVWLNNEEDNERVSMKVIQSALEWTEEEVEYDWAHTYSEYEKVMGGNIHKIRVVDVTGKNIRMVERIIREIGNVGLIIMDQLRKIRGYDGEASETIRQELLYSWARDLSKTVAPVLAVHQADGTAENQRWIDMSQFHMSKTGIQGEADAIITIGRDESHPISRYFYIPKNKMRGTDPSARNGRFEVEIDGARARYKEY